MQISTDLAMTQGILTFMTVATHMAERFSGSIASSFIPTWNLKPSGGLFNWKMISFSFFIPPTKMTIAQLLSSQCQALGYVNATTG